MHLALMIRCIAACEQQRRKILISEHYHMKLGIMLLSAVLLVGNVCADK